MRHFWALVLVTAMIPAARAVEKQYANAQFVDIQQKTNTKVLYYIVNTPITQDEPYFEVSVRINDTVYLGRYIPRHASETLPEEWQPGSSVQARVEAHHLYLRKPSGVDVDFAIAKRTAVKPEQTIPQPATK